MKNKILGVLSALLISVSSLVQAAPTVIVYEWAVQAGKADDFAAAPKMLCRKARSPKIERHSFTSNLLVSTE